MAYRSVDLIEVHAWGRPVGAAALDPRSGFYAFQYDQSWLRDGVSMAPLAIPFDGRSRVASSLPATFFRLPALLADSLPDRFGNSLIDAFLATEGVGRDVISPLDRLAYLGDRAMGALEFRPPAGPAVDGASLFEIATLVDEARRAVEGSFGTPTDATAGVRDLLLIGTSAGGARAKAVIAWNPSTGEIRSGQVDAPAGFEPWLIKFDGVGTDPDLGTSGDYGRIEYAYHRMATAAGIAMSDCRLLEEGRRAHFMTRRFDRIGSTKVHTQTLCAMGELDFNAIGVHDYAQFIAIIDRLGLGPDARAEAFRRAVFNIASSNCDDHTKNQAFLLEPERRWRLAPAYDVTHAYNPSGRWTHQHLMGIGGVFIGAERDHLLRFADRHAVPGAKAIIDDINGAIESWPDHAQTAGLPGATADRVACDLHTV
ncbi:type II toxin-antitoxin system HipA family toxin [soil metagenome]